MTINYEPILSGSQFEKLSKIVHADTGIVLSEEKKGLLVSRLTKRLRALNLSDFSSYCDHLNGPNGEIERRQLLSAITTNVTSFFRETHHFEALKRLFESHLEKRAKVGRRIRIWSSACSSGPEAYSIAMTLFEIFPDIACHDVLILASDIDPKMIHQAEKGFYSADEVKNLTNDQLKRFFIKVNNGYQVKEDLKRIMRFAEINLHKDWPFSGQFDIIFCRNVVIYFDAVHRQRLWNRFAQVMPSKGRLFIGHSERIDGLAMSEFTLVGSTEYERN